MALTDLLPFPIPSVGKIKLALGIALAVGVAATIGILMWQLHSVKMDLAQANMDKGKLTTAVQTQNATISSLKKNNAAWVAAQGELLQRFKELTNVQLQANKETRRLADIFAKHDLGALALAKPGLIEDRITAGTRSTLSVLSHISSGHLGDTYGGSDSGEAPSSTKSGSGGAAAVQMDGNH